MTLSDIHNVYIHYYCITVMNFFVMYFLYYVTSFMEILFILCTYLCYYLALESYNLSLSHPPQSTCLHVRVSQTY